MSEYDEQDQDFNEQDFGGQDSERVNDNAGQQGDDDEFEITPEMLLGGDDPEREQPEKPDPQRELLERAIRAEERARLMEQQRQGDAQEPQQTIQDRILERQTRIQELQAQMPPKDTEDPQQQAQRILLMTEKLELQQEVADMRDEVRDAEARQFKVSRAVQGFKDRARKSDANFQDPTFERAFDEFVRREIPAHLQGDHKVLDLARAKVGYRYLQLKMQGRTKELDDAISGPKRGMTPQQARAGKPKPVKLSETEQRLKAFYDLADEDYQRFGRDEEEFDLGAVQYTHTRRRR